MTECTAENALKLLNFRGISLPPNEMNIFEPEFKKFMNSSGKNYDFLQATGKFYSEILPAVAYPDERIDNDYRRLARDNIFQEKVMNSTIAEKLRAGTSLSSLIRNSINKSRTNSFS